MTTGPHNLSKTDWFYEERHSLLLVHEVYRKGEYVCTEQVRIPWRKIEESLRRRAARKRAAKKRAR